MAPVINAVSKSLTGENNFCRLCFVTVERDAVRLQDEVFLKGIASQNTQEILTMLNYVLGEEHASNMSLNDSICTNCLDSVKTSYKFVKMCKENSTCFINTINSLADCFENTTDDLNFYNHLFVNVETKTYSSKQYYDKQRSVTNLPMALARYRSLAYGKYVRRKESKGAQKRKLHDYGEEMNQICDIVRENNQTKFICKVCAGVFSKSFNFKKHYYSRHSEKLIECPDCDRRYGSEALLKQHRYDSHINIVCSECGKTYNNRYSLLYHMRGHSGEEPYECQHCGMMFQWSSRRAEHIRRFHLEPSVECNICHIKFRSLGSMYEHRKRHFNPNSRLHVMQQTPPVAEEAEV